MSIYNGFTYTLPTIPSHICRCCQITPMWSYCSDYVVDHAWIQERDPPTSDLALAVVHGEEAPHSAISFPPCPATLVNNFALWIFALFHSYLIPSGSVVLSQQSIPSAIISAEAHSRPAQSILLFQLCWMRSLIAGLMHRNLMLISNLAEQTKRQRMKLSVIAQYIRKQLGPSESTSEEGASKLPRVILTVGLPGKHQCRCPTCDPKFNQEPEAAAAKRAEDTYASRLEEPIKREMKEKTVANFGRRSSRMPSRRYAVN